jgi:hypothetical protein
MIRQPSLSPPLTGRRRSPWGQPGIRNLMLSGSMLGAMTIVEADQTHVTIAFTRQAELAKASKNQDRDRWYGISKNDEGKILVFADRILLNKSSH